jgi:hypothetical protein
MCAEQAIYALAWSPDSDQIVSSCGPNLSIKPIQVLISEQATVCSQKTRLIAQEHHVACRMLGIKF